MVGEVRGQHLIALGGVDAQMQPFPAMPQRSMWRQGLAGLGVYGGLRRAAEEVVVHEVHNQHLEQKAPPRETLLPILLLLWRSIVVATTSHADGTTREEEDVNLESI